MTNQWNSIPKHRWDGKSRKTAQDSSENIKDTALDLILRDHNCAQLFDTTPDEISIGAVFIREMH